MIARTLLPLAAAALLGGCAHRPAPPAAPADRFLAALRPLCGKAFEGRLASAPNPADSDFSGKRLVMHVASCDSRQVRIPFHVGDDRSRTWVITRTAQGLRLKHDHRHADGSPDALTLYGGDSDGPGSATRQRFPADSESRALFTATGRTVSLSNVWAIEIAGGRFAYELSRPDRHFRVEFDLTRPVPAPPPAW